MKIRKFLVRLLMTPVFVKLLAQSRNQNVPPHKTPLGKFVLTEVAKLPGDTVENALTLEQKETVINSLSSYQLQNILVRKKGINGLLNTFNIRDVMQNVINRYPLQSTLSEQMDLAVRTEVIDHYELTLVAFLPPVYHRSLPWAQAQALAIIAETKNPLSQQKQLSALLDETFNTLKKEDCAVFSSLLLSQAKKRSAQQAPVNFAESTKDA